MTGRPLTPAHHAMLDWLIDLALSPPAKEPKPCALPSTPESQPTADEIPEESTGGEYKRPLRVRIR